MLNPESKYGGVEAMRQLLIEDLVKKRDGWSDDVPETVISGKTKGPDGRDFKVRKNCGGLGATLRLALDTGLLSESAQEQIRQYGRNLVESGFQNRAYYRRRYSQGECFNQRSFGRTSGIWK